ncbi:MAG: hypothetical protein ACJA1F_001314 [Paracoccaceae bacterium]|jgi:hypothetical protein
MFKGKRAPAADGCFACLRIASQFEAEYSISGTCRFRRNKTAKNRITSSF